MDWINRFDWQLPTASCRLPTASSHTPLRPGCNAIGGEVEVLNGIGDAEANVSFAMRAECGAGEARHPGLLQQRGREVFGAPAGFRDVREDVKSALGHAAGEARNVVQSLDKAVAAAAEFFFH